MQANVLTEIFLPVALGIIMLGMGLALTLEDFKRVALFPRATFVGLFCQLIVLPLVAFAMLQVLSLPPELAVGVMLLSFCPGGATSNLLSNLARADVALSITLTAISSMITVFTIPYFVNLSMEYFIGEGKYVELPVLKTMLQIVVITIIPVSIGMLIRWKFPEGAKRSEKPVKIASAVFITLVILGAILKEKDNIAGYFVQVGVITLLINVVILAGGYLMGKLFRLSHPQRAAVSIESGIQNGTLAIAIATSSLLLNNSQMSIPAAVYSLIMFATGGVAVYLYSRNVMFDRA
ncbi:MAG: bile acid:sodium symporter family protein [Cyclobacteriaceae bacterium]|nr:MAG: bile acid:sodium symporter family protein [Cyclobacteriaceae bacterium]